MTSLSVSGVQRETSSRCATKHHPLLLNTHLSKQFYKKKNGMKNKNAVWLNIFLWALLTIRPNKWRWISKTLTTTLFTNSFAHLSFDVSLAVPNRHLVLFNGEHKTVTHGILTAVLRCHSWNPVDTQTDFCTFIQGPYWWYLYQSVLKDILQLSITINLLLFPSPFLTPTQLFM